MKKFSKLFLLLLLFASPAFGGQKEEETFDFTIESHTYRDNDYPAYLSGFSLGEEEAQLTLGDGSTWEVESCPPKQLVPEILKGWKPGHEIRIETRTPSDKTRPGKYMLKNVTTQTLLFCSLKEGPTKEWETHRIIKIDENGYFLALDNGSEWYVNWLPSWSTYKWHPGDRVMVNRSACCWLFINPERKHHQSAYVNKVKWK